MIASILRWALRLPAVVLEWLRVNVYCDWHHIAAVWVLVLFTYAVVQILHQPSVGWTAGAAVLGVIAGLLGTQHVSTGYVHMRKETEKMKTNGHGSVEPRPDE